MRAILLAFFCCFAGPLLAQPAQGSFTVRKYRCIPDSVRKAIEASDRTWPGQDIAAVSGTLWSGDAANKEFIAKATILIYKGDALITFTQTDEKGHYTSYLPVGKYRLVTCKDGYKSTSKEVEPQRKMPFLYDIDLETILERSDSLGSRSTPPDSLSEGVFAVANSNNEIKKAPGRLRGNITLLESDFPMDEVEVRLYQEDELIQSVYCSDLGFYSFRDLADGRYDLVIINNRNDNAPIPDIKIEMGKITMLNVRLTPGGKIKRKDRFGN